MYKSSRSRSAEALLTVHRDRGDPTEIVPVGNIHSLHSKAQLLRACGVSSSIISFANDHHVCLPFDTIIEMLRPILGLLTASVDRSPSIDKSYRYDSHLQLQCVMSDCHILMYNRQGIFNHRGRKAPPSNKDYRRQAHHKAQASLFCAKVEGIALYYPPASQ